MRLVVPDGFFSADLLEVDHPALAQCFYNVLLNVWDTRKVRQQRVYGIIKVVHKKQNRTDCNIYLNISLVGHAGKDLFSITPSRPKH